MSAYKKHKPFLIAIDCIILAFDGQALKVLLIKRDFNPEKGKISLLGGFLSENEALDEAANRILQELTGLNNIFLEQFHSYGAVNRDSEARVVSVAYTALIKLKDIDPSFIAKNDANWYDINKVPKLIFDHNQMVNDAQHWLSIKCDIQPVGLELLPDKFTLPQLQTLYEAIYQEKIDKRNFRKKILSLNLIKRLDIKDKGGSRKGAFLYEVDNMKNVNLRGVNSGVKN